MAIPTDQNRSLLTVIASMRAKPGKEAELRRELEALIQPTQAEDGNVTYALHQGADDDAVFYFYENWESAQKLEAHLQNEHLVRFSGLAGDLLDGDLHIQQLKRIA